MCNINGAIHNIYLINNKMMTIFWTRVYDNDYKPLAVWSHFYHPHLLLLIRLALMSISEHVRACGRVTPDVAAILNGI